MAGKKFKFRVDSNNDVGIKEDVTKTIGKRSTKIRVTLCLDGELDLAPLAVFKENILVNFQLEGVGYKDKYILYYPFDSITYIATVIIELREDKKIKSKDIVIYMPKGIVSLDELYCERVTSTFSRVQKEEILNKVINFATSRI